jgi:hypothetical protein
MRARKSLRIVSILSLLFALLSPAVSVQAAVPWVTGLAWGNLSVDPQEGVFQRYRREFDNNSVLQVNSPTQHDTAWIRTDQNSITVNYKGGVGNANKQVQFLSEGSTTYTDNRAEENDVVVTDGSGNASITYTLSGTPQEDDYVLVSLKADAVTVGPMILVWKKSGFFPIIKLMGTPGGNEAICDSKFNCQYSDLIEKTWEWSVFKRDWLPEYSQVYVKSYTPGAVIRLNYKVTDIWGDPIADKEINLGLDTKCSKCRWGSFAENRTTNEAGEVSFSLPNKNTAAQIASNTYVNTDTKKQEGGIIAFAIVPTANEIEESADMFWPQLITTQTIKSSGFNIAVKSRGGIAANGYGNVVVDSVTNPALRLDPLGETAADQIKAHFTITYEKATDARSNILYSPTVTVTADNGGVAGLVSSYHGRGYDTFLDVSQMKSKLEFNYVYNLNNQQYGVDLVFAGTRPGLTTFTVAVGDTKKTFTQEFFTEPKDARFIRPISQSLIGVPGVNKSVTFEVVDRFGNGVANIPVNLATSGAGSLVSPVETVMTDAKGRVTAVASNAAATAQTITATVAVDQVAESQFAAPAVAEIGLAAGSATTSANVAWGTVDISLVAAKGAIKVSTLNAKGKTVTVLRGTKKLFTYKPTTANFVKAVKTLKGTSAFTVRIGNVSKTAKLVVK